MARRKKTTDETPIEVPSTQSDDNFGLPDIDFQPLDRTTTSEPQPPAQEPVAQQQQPSTESTPAPETTSYQSSYSSSYSSTETQESGSSLPKIFAIVIVVALALTAGWYFAVYKPQKDAEAKALSEKNRKEAEAKEQARLLEEERLAEERRRAAEAANAAPKEGSIETLSERSGRYYVVAASSIDADLIMDYAKKLSAKGVTCKIIPPYGKVKFSRLTVAEGDTYADTQKVADGLKGEYTDALWVIKY